MSEEASAVQAARIGWQCPACLTCWSPDVEACSCTPPRPTQLPHPGQPSPTFMPTGCTCGPWLSILPPPPCSVHTVWSGSPPYATRTYTITTTTSGVETA